MIVTTGRTTSFTWSGDIAGPSYDNTLGGNVIPIDSYINTADVAGGAAGASFSVEDRRGITTEEAGSAPPANHLWMGRVVAVNTGLGDTDVDYAFEAYRFRPPGLPGIYDKDIDGSWSISVDVEECLEIGGSGFASYGGPGVADLPLWTHVRQFWRARPGGSLTVTCAAGGATASATTAITTGNAFEVEAAWSGTATCTGYSRAGSASLGVEFQGVGLTADYARTAPNASADCNGGCHVACSAVTDTPTGAVATAVLYPVRAFSLAGTTHDDVGDYPSAVDYKVDRYLDGGEAETIAGAPGFSTSYSQKRYTAGCTLNGAAQDTVTVNEWMGLRVWIDPEWIAAEDEDANAWRCMQRGRVYDALTLSQAKEVTIDDCLSLTPSGDWAGVWSAVAHATVTHGAGIQAVIAGGVGSIKRTFTPNRGGMGSMRYLAIDMVSSPSGKPYSVKIGSKVWTTDKAGAPLVTQAAAGSPQQIDLCVPTNLTASSDSLDSRWPTPTSDGSPTGTGSMWGVQHPAELRIESLEDGVTYQVHELAIVRTAAPLVTFGAPCGEWIVESDGSGRRQFLRGRTHWKSSIEETDGVHNVDDSYGQRTIAHLAEDVTQIDPGLGVRNPGWDCDVATAIDVADGADYDNWEWNYLNRQRPATWLYGNGALFARADAEATSSSWLNGFDLPVQDPPELPLAVPAQILYDAMDWQPVCGDVWGHNPDATRGTLVGGLVAVAAARLRGISWGIVVDQDNRPLGSVDVNATDVSTADAGTGTTDSEGGYLTGTPGGVGGHSISTECDVGGVSAVVRTFYSRKRHRACLRSAPPTSDYKCLEVDSPRGWIHVGAGKRIRTHHINDWTPAFVSPEYDVDEWHKLRVDSRRALLLMLGRSGEESPYTWSVQLSHDGGYSAEEVMSISARTALIERDSPRGWLVVLYEDDDAIQRRVSLDGGVTWETAAATTGLTAGELVDITMDTRRPVMAMVVKVGTAFEVWSSADAGESWEQVLS